MLSRASEILEVPEKELKVFSVQDTFNNDNILSGCLCRRSDHRYGAIVLFTINEEETEQIIWATPKLHYPMDISGRTHWPKNVIDVQAYEKVDGTNILAYRYLYKGKEFTTFKTRLTPVVSDSAFGDFLGMWKEVLIEDKSINKVISSNPEYNLSFELYGWRNPITIKYSFPLKAALLFGIKRDPREVVPRTNLSNYETTSFLKTVLFEDFRDLDELYDEIRDETTEQNAEEFLIEGFVFYVKSNSGWEMFKCKAEQIETLHRLASASINKQSLWTTAINAHEDTDDVTIDYFIELLKEEYDEVKIGRSMIRIEKTLAEAKNHLKFVKKVNERIMEAKKDGLDVTKDKTSFMRYMSKFFQKNEMRKVGSIVLK